MQSNILDKSKTALQALPTEVAEANVPRARASTNNPPLLSLIRALPRSKPGWLLLTFGFALLLSVFTTWIQVDKLNVAHLELGIQINRHQAILGGYSGDPWQYRLLSEYAAEWSIITLRALGLAHPVAWGFILLRIVQNVLIFGLMSAYYHKLGLNTYTALVGWLLLAWAMTYSNYNADLSFNTYTGIIFYLLAALAIMGRKYLWTLPITLLAALDRETNALIPFMLLGYALISAPSRKLDKRALTIFALSLLAFFAVFFGLRLWFAPRPQLIPPGLDLLANNLADPITWMQLLATFTIVPLLAILSFQAWPRTLKLFFWLIIPIWLAVHLYSSILAETRLLLVPFVLVIIPGALFGLERKLTWNPQ
jgi:hypothetical protein